ncbi:MAG: hypothetical protein DBY17_03020 [Oscillospiraceae bacterium]|nr:MAG: hypothetical protein DBY17_03020 [Oscillospiraceae bacterium]
MQTYPARPCDGPLPCVRAALAGPHGLLFPHGLCARLAQSARMRYNILKTASEGLPDETHAAHLKKGGRGQKATVLPHGAKIK